MSRGGGGICSQAAQQENERKRDFLMSLRVEVPDLSQGKNENDNIRCDIRYGAADKEMLHVYALGFCIQFIPETIDRIAGKGGNQDDCDPPCNDHSLHGVRDNFDFGDGEDSAVKGKDRELDCQYSGGVEEFVGKEALFRSQKRVLFWHCAAMLIKFLP